MRHTRRPHRDRIGYITIAAVLLATTLGCVAEGGRRQTIHHPVLRGYDPAIEPYVAFLQRQSTAPADYILGLFERYDIVILCERTHSETTQWDMIYELTSDARFIDEVGVIFTEYGTVTLQPLLDEFLMAPDLSPEQAKQKLLHIARNLTPWWPIQLNRNFYDYLAKLRTLNGTLPQDKKIRLYFCDVPWDWNTTTTETLLQAWREVVKRRDLIMAQRVIEERRRRLAAGERNKCLVIMNYRHAFRQMDNTGRYIFEAFPGEVTNVLINTFTPVTARSDRDISFDVIQDGKWDAAFESIGNPALGFDFQDSPFGNDSFDLFPFDPAAVAALHYEDMFTGFVFHEPLSAHRLAEGIPGFFDEAFVEEVRRRFRLAEGTELAQRYSPSGFEASIARAIGQGIPLGKISSSRDVNGLYSRQKIARWLADDDAQAEDE